MSVVACCVLLVACVLFVNGWLLVFVVDHSFLFVVCCVLCVGGALVLVVGCLFLVVCC